MRQPPPVQTYQSYPMARSEKRVYAAFLIADDASTITRAVRCWTRAPFTKKTCVGMPSQDLPQNPLKSSVGKWKFIAKAVNGKKECSVSFFINVTFDGAKWNYEYGETKP